MTGGPWGTNWGAGPWQADSDGDDRMYRFYPGGHRSRTWSYGEDDPTEIWTLGGGDRAVPEPAGGAASGGAASGAAGAGGALGEAVGGAAAAGPGRPAHGGSPAEGWSATQQAATVRATAQPEPHPSTPARIAAAAEPHGGTAGWAQPPAPQAYASTATQNPAPAEPYAPTSAWTATASGPHADTAGWTQPPAPQAYASTATQNPAPAEPYADTAGWASAPAGQSYPSTATQIAAPAEPYGGTADWTVPAEPYRHEPGTAPPTSYGTTADWADTPAPHAYADTPAWTSAPASQSYTSTAAQIAAPAEPYADSPAWTAAPAEPYRYEPTGSPSAPWSAATSWTVAPPEPYPSPPAGSSPEATAVAVEPAEPYRHEVSRTGPQRGSYLDGLGQTGPARTSRTMLDATPVSRSRTAARRGRARRHGRARIAIIAVVAALGAVALVATAVNALTAGSHPAAATPVPRPSPSTSTSGATPQPQSTWRYIDARADDPIPLTLAELFPAHVSAGQVTYGRTAERATTTCRGAVFGARLKAAVAKGCSQALRASYLSGDAKQMGTIGVLNLATSAAAAKVGKIVASAGEFIEPLPAAHGATKNLGKGTGVVWAVAKGHYLILMWAQYANLHSPTSSHDRKVLMQLLNDLYRTTANQSLTGRMVTGKPSTP